MSRLYRVQCDGCSGWLEVSVAVEPGLTAPADLVLPCPRCGSRFALDLDEDGEVETIRPAIR
jgi:uncharacterized metal-binding protein YceD (DUF177 family)